MFYSLNVSFIVWREKQRSAIHIENQVSLFELLEI